MKPNFKFVLILSLFALFTFNGCQNETIEETQNQEETIAPDSTVADLLRNTAANNGSLDNVMDGANCFSVNLPVTIVVNGITITINTLEDLALIEEIYDEFEDDEDFLEFLFPITIILNDYTEIVIENEEQLEAFIEECTEDDDDVIECVDFVYPISFSIYNSDFQIIDTVIIENDEELYDFLEELEDNPSGGAILASLNFPVTLIYADGTTVEVNSNQELEAAINAAEEVCDDDEEEDECEFEDIVEELTECPWIVVLYNGDDNLVNYELYFHENGELSIAEGGVNDAIVGLWDLVETDEGLVLVITQLTALEDLGGEWLIVDCDDDRLELKRETENGYIEIVMEQDCEDDLDCSAQEISGYLQNCYWYGASNLFANVVAEKFDFQENGVVEAINSANDVVTTGSWSIILTDEGVFLVLEFDQEPYSLISLEWLIVECDYDHLYMINGDNYLVLEKDCSDEYDCPELQANVGDDCETAAGSIGYINEDCECVEENNQYDCPDLEANFGDDCETANGNIGFINENCECEEDDNQFDCPDQQANIGDECETPNGAFGFINENCECEVEDSNPFECFGDYALTICDDDVIDGFAAFDLEFIFANCPEDNVEYAFYATLADAEAQVNELVNPFVNTVNPQTIYSRVQLAGDPSTYEIFEHVLIVEDCTQDGCTEAELDNILMECAWNPVSLNGSDDFSEVWMLFGDNQELIVEGLGLNATGNWQTAGDPSTGVYLIMSGFNNQFQVLIGEWLVVECSNEQLVLVNTANQAELILERNCS